jgi:proteasome lid subunit RPN8/RPN11
MTAPLADQTPAQTPAPALSLSAASVGLAGAAWVVYFASLIAVYLTAMADHVKACEAAAGWGLGISFAAALLVVVFAVSRPLPAGYASLRIPAARALAVGGLLATASVAVVWVAINLTLIRDTAGAWMLTTCAAAAPAAALLARSALAPRAGIAGDDAVAAPSTMAIAGPEPASAAAFDIAAPPEVVAPLDPVALPEVVAPLDPVAPPEVVALPMVVAPPDAAEAVSPEVSAPTASVLTKPWLLVPDWAERLGNPPPRVAIDMGMWGATLAALVKRRTEVGGVALTVRVPGTLIVLGLVLPKQVHASGVSCEFPSEEVGRVRDVVDGVADILGRDTRDVKFTWVHTHPGMGPFLSGIDKATTQAWRVFDPDFMPIVLDPLAQRLNKQFGIFDTDNEKIEQIRVVEGLADSHVIELLKDELIEVYRDGRGTMVLFGSD